MTALLCKGGADHHDNRNYSRAPRRAFAGEMGALRIVQIGVASGTSRARCRALERLGHDALLIDPFDALPRHRVGTMWSVHTGAFGMGGRVARNVLARIPRAADLIIVDSGELVAPALVRALRRIAPRIVNINLDNPYVPRDGRRWRLFLQALPLYDMIFTPRDSSVASALAMGARRAHRIWQAADDPLRDPAHHPTEEERAPYRSPVSFVGTWMPERGAFLAELIERGVPLRIVGPRWDRAPELKRHRDRIVDGWLSADRYHAAVAAADISIALLSKGNHDVHTTRSLEIPTLGSLLCGERTPDHLALYDEGTEAFFWVDAPECAATCLTLLADTPRLAAARAAGHARALVNGHFNEALMTQVVEQAMRP